MKNHQLVVDIEDFRAIKKAEIILDGITVVAGENGCGKSTLSKLLYYLFKTANEYEFYLVQEVKDELSTINFIIEQIFISSKLLRIDLEEANLDEYKKSLLLQLVDIRKIISIGIVKIKDAAFFDRLLKIYNSEIKGINRYRALSLPDMIDKIEMRIEKTFEKAFNLKTTRPSIILNNAIKNSFTNESLPKVLQLIEHGYSIYSSEAEHISRIHSVNNISYIDTPMAVGLEKSQKNEHWNDLNNMLRERRGQSGNGYLALIQSQILNGEIVVDNDITKRFIYKRNDGKEFDLLSCATGVKSFAILQLLYKNGHLNDKTLLIIDEPEVHLHPQWIVEYARLMVLLNKELGVKFFIASHNPDMVSAIKYISEKEQTDGNLNYYLAEKEENEFTYSYRHLGTEIDDIFGSFNIAIDRINLYGI